MILNSLAMQPKSGTILAGGYPAIPSGTSDWGANGIVERHFLSANNQSRIWASGTLTQVQLRIEWKPAQLTAFFVDVWRKNAAGTYDRIGHEEVLSRLTAGQVSTVTLTTPVQVLAGDYVGYGVVGSSALAYVMKAITAQAAGSSYFANALPAANGYAWEAQTASTSWFVVKAFVTVAPMIVGVGDSIMAGHGANYTVAENSKATSASSDIVKTLGAALGVTNAVNLGIGSQTTAQIAARVAADVVALSPRIAILNGGVNDIAGGATTQAAFLANWTTLLEACQSAWIVPIVIPVLPWTNGTNAQMQTRDAWNAALKALVATYPQAVYVEEALTALGQFRAGGDDGNLWDIKAAYNGDGVHFNAAGYGALAVMILRSIARRSSAYAIETARADLAADIVPLATAADVLASQGNIVAAMPSGFATPADVTSARDAIVAVIDTPADWIAITPATLDTNGDALGSIDRADVEIVAYLSTDESLATPISKTVSEIDGGFTLRVPPAATYTLVARAVGRSYGNRTVTV